MVRNIDEKALLLGPRDRGLAFTSQIKELNTISVGENIMIDDVSITGIKTTHGSLTFKFGPLAKTIKPGPEERIGWGAIGFKIQFAGKTFVNLGDTLFHGEEWASINSPDILMIPIGGRKVNNTMDVESALKAVKLMLPKLVIPCHYNCPALFTKKFNPADDQYFKEEVQKLGFACKIMKNGEKINI